MKRKIKVGVVGAGFISNFHMRALSELQNVKVVGICDLDLRRAQQLANANGVATAFGSVEELADRTKPDVVHVVTPPPIHYQSIIRCFEAGTAVFAEKPVVTNSDDGRLLMRAQIESRAYVGVNHNAIFFPAFRRAVRLIENRRLGAVEHVIGCLNVPLRQLAAGQHGHWMFAAPGNIVLEQGPHPLSQICFLAGNVMRVAGLRSGENLLNTGGKFYDTWQLTLECERATAQCFLSFGKSFAELWIHVIGQDGSIFVDLLRNTVRLCDKSRFMPPADYARTAVDNAVGGGTQGLGNLVSYGLGLLKLRPDADPFYCSLRDSIHAFHQAYSEGRNPPVTLTQGCEMVQLCEQISATTSDRTELHAG